MSARQRAREAQSRLAQMREDDRAGVPKIALSVMAALHVLLVRLDTVVSIAEICDLCGEPEREAHRGVAWLRDHDIIAREVTKGGSGHAARTQFMTDAETADALRAALRRFEDRRV